MIKENIAAIRKELPPHVTLVAVTKTHPVEKLEEAYAAGLRLFGENRVQEMMEKQPLLPADVQWHLIGHLQTNKVKYIAPFVALIHSIDSLKLLQEVNKQAARNGRVLDCLLQIHIAKEETKFGLDRTEAETLLGSEAFKQMKNIRVTGLMGMATNTDNTDQVRQEFRTLKIFYDRLGQLPTVNCKLETLSMGMTSDYRIAIEEGSNMVRIGSAIFGSR